MPNQRVCFDFKNQHVCLRVLKYKEDRQRGFQLVEQIQPNEGLLYWLQDPRSTSFWMKDVLLQLDILFIDKEGRILELVSAEPHCTNTINPPVNAQYAIELAGGIAKELQLIKGTKLSTDIIAEFHGAFQTNCSTK
jgi:uncharacterized membrane protein (UPF0127 family)